jgi:hypothetical protein
MPQMELDFSAYIAERTRDFIGRERVFAEIDAWLADPDGPRSLSLAGWASAEFLPTCAGTVNEAHISHARVDAALARDTKVE